MEKLENESEDVKVILHYNPSIFLQHKWFILSVFREYLKIQIKSLSIQDHLCFLNSGLCHRKSW